MISATNGKTTTAGHARVGPPRGRAHARPQPRRFEHELGRRDRPSRAEGSRRALRGGRGVASADGRGARPAADRPLQPLPRPARPLRGARAARRRMGRDGAEVRRRPYGPRPERRRPARRRPGPRLGTRAATRTSRTSGSRTPRRRCPASSTPTTPSTAADAERRTAYERAFVGHLGHYSCPNCDADRPTPDVAATRIELDGMRGSRVEVSTPGRAPRAPSPLPGPLQRLQRARGALGRDPAGRRAERRRPGPRADRGSLRAGRDDRGRGQGGLDPPHQESRRRERGDPHAPPRERAVRRRRGHPPVGRAQRPDRRRARRLVGLGRRLRAPRRVGRERDLRGNARARDGGPPEVRGPRSGDRITSTTTSRDRSIAPSPRLPSAYSPSPPTPRSSS